MLRPEISKNVFKAIWKALSTSGLRFHLAPYERKELSL